MDGTFWSGLLLAGNNSKGHGPAAGIALAHGQRVHYHLNLEPNTKVMIYQAKLGWKDGPVLDYGDDTKHVQIPSDEDIQWNVVKEVCSGMGCMGLAARFLGLHSAAAMDWNPKIVEHLRDNHHEGALVGNVNLIEDRYRLHMMGGPTRCTLLCGFPCQPLSSQGDLRGDKVIEHSLFSTPSEWPGNSKWGQ